jgi:hypothetical protein
MMHNQKVEERVFFLKPHWSLLALFSGAVLVATFFFVLVSAISNVVGQWLLRPAEPVVSDAPPDTAMRNPFLFEEVHLPGDTFTVAVTPSTIHVIVAGPVCIEEVCTPGGRQGEDRVTLLLLLPSVYPYVVEVGRLPFWHEAYYGEREQWPIVADDRIEMLGEPGRCIGGCDMVDLVVYGPEGVVHQVTWHDRFITDP